MPKRPLPYRDPNYVPKMTLHKASGRAVVRLSGKDHYLGPWASREAVVAYHKLIAEWNERDCPTLAMIPSADGLSVNELVLAYVQHAEGYYRKNGATTDEVWCIKSAMKHLVALYGLAPAAELSPLKVKAVRERMIEENDWSRGFVNRSISRIKRMLKWATENELIPVTVFQAVSTVAGLLRGRSSARETPGRGPVLDADVEAVRTVVSQSTRDLIDLQLLAAARPGELLSLTWGQIDQTGEVWLARLKTHKNEHHGKQRTLFFGPRARLILERYRKADPAAKLFPLGTAAYWERIRHGCIRAGVQHWCPHALRHTAATRLREEFGIEAAQVLCGHSSADMTLHYARRNEKAGRDVALKIG